MLQRLAARARLGLAVFAVAGATASTVNAQSSRTPAATPANPASLHVVNAKWTGDFDGMVKRRQIRILTPYSRTHYFIDKGVQRGVVYDAGMKLEADLNKTLKTTPATKIHVAFLPTSRDDLFPALVEGRGDIIAANVTVTPERAKLVDFTGREKPTCAKSSSPVPARRRSIRSMISAARMSTSARRAFSSRA